MVIGFSSKKYPKINKVLLLTNAGGVGIMAADACEDHQVQLTSLSEETKKKLREKLPLASSISNPLDILGDAKPERFRFALKTVLADPNVDSILLLITPQSTTNPQETARVIEEICKNTKKLLLSCFMGGKTINKAIPILHKAGIPNYKDPEAAVKVLQSIIMYTQLSSKKEGKIKIFPVDKTKAENKWS